MLLNDPITLLLIITPFGLLTALMLCLSGIGLSERHTALWWWLGGDLLLAAYRIVDLLQPDVATGAYAWLGVLAPMPAFLLNTTLLLAAIGGHTLALLHLAGRAGSRTAQAALLLGTPMTYALGASMLIHSSYLLPWFFLICFITIGIQCRLALSLTARYRGAWGLAVGQLALLAFHAWNVISLLLSPPPPLAFDTPDMFTLPELAMDFMVSFLFTLCFGLMLQEQVRLEILRLSVTDFLTGALNRAGATTAILRKDAQRYPLAIALIDLDNFKRINDQHGHGAGDTGLKLFASTVTQLKRRTDLFSRWGGEEFLLVMPGTTTPEARVLLDRLREALEVESMQLPFTLRFSAGLAQTERLHGQQDFERLLRSVDQALYRAKLQRDRVEEAELADT
ncbi:GGDEF domain-containing protein [Pseudomonas sp.]|uniref:GGDEF domain-containing protein n=1 Tax=Pseudomonas sp. TaxID=306 RepID=UPI00227CF6F1|nr:GGDEF domain-containing protein [Pseudomonas sp.]WAH57810.1 GGDEF domain-containing protein [Pseudomonas silvicola]